MTRAPAKYTGIGAPFTLEIPTFDTGGIRSARPERPNAETRPDMSHGAPNIGKSSSMTDLKRFKVPLAAFDEAWIDRRRSTGSATSVHRLTRMPLT